MFVLISALTDDRYLSIEITILRVRDLAEEIGLRSTSEVRDLIVKVGRDKQITIKVTCSQNPIVHVSFLMLDRLIVELTC